MKFTSLTNTRTINYTDLPNPGGQTETHSRRLVILYIPVGEHPLKSMTYVVKPPRAKKKKKFLIFTVYVVIYPFIYN